MKTFMVIMSLIIATNVKAQKDTVSYLDHKYTIGDTVQLSYGSGVNKSFVFVFMGRGLTGMQNIGATASKSKVVIDKVYQQRGKNMIRGKLIGAFLGGAKIFIDIEGAIDNKEIL